MYNKILIKGTIEVKTGLHIGTGGEFAAIGAIDSPVVRDSISSSPIIPGSSLKGKIRALLSKKYSPNAAKADDDSKEICRLFGSGSGKERSRLLFSDSIMSNRDELKNLEVNETEVKFENTINRLTGVANPRQIERVVRGAKFDLEIIYDVLKEKDVIEDISLLCEGLKLLKYDYLGGHGSRGSGKIDFVDISAEYILGENETIENKCNELLKGV